MNAKCISIALHTLQNVLKHTYINKQQYNFYFSKIHQKQNQFQSSSTEENSVITVN